MNTDNINNITVKGYNSFKKTYKIQLDFNVDSDGNEYK